MKADLVPRWTDITRGLPFLLVKLILNEEKQSEIRVYWDSIPREHCFKANWQLSISFSGFHAPINFTGTLAGVATRFGTYSSSQPRP
jgi:hypothetical protein